MNPKAPTLAPTNGHTPQPAAPLPEAPASVTLNVNYRGFDLLFTVRDYRASSLLDKLELLIDDLEQRGATPSRRGGGPMGGAAGQQGQSQAGAPICPTHGRPMRQGQRGGWFCSAKIAEDGGDGKPVYCKQKAQG
jgi:hypothetical protein